MGRGKCWSREESEAVAKAWKLAAVEIPSPREQNTKRFATELYHRFVEFAPNDDDTAQDGRWKARSLTAVKTQFDAIGDDIIKFNHVYLKTSQQALTRGLEPENCLVLRAAIAIHLGAALPSPLDFSQVDTVEADWKLYEAWCILKSCHRFTPATAASQPPPPPPPQQQQQQAQQHGSSSNLNVDQSTPGGGVTDNMTSNKGEENSEASLPPPPPTRTIRHSPSVANTSLALRTDPHRRASSSAVATSIHNNNNNSNPQLDSSVAMGRESIVSNGGASTVDGGTHAPHSSGNTPMKTLASAALSTIPLAERGYPHFTHHHNYNNSADRRYHQHRHGTSPPSRRARSRPQNGAEMGDVPSRPVNAVGEGAAVGGCGGLIEARRPLKRRLQQQSDEDEAHRVKNKVAEDQINPNEDVNGQHDQANNPNKATERAMDSEHYRNGIEAEAEINMERDATRGALRHDVNDAVADHSSSFRRRRRRRTSANMNPNGGLAVNHVAGGGGLNGMVGNSSGGVGKVGVGGAGCQLFASADAIELVGQALRTLGDALSEYNAITLFSRPDMQGRQDQKVFLNTLAEKHVLKAQMERDELAQELARMKNGRTGPSASNMNNDRSK